MPDPTAELPLNIDSTMIVCSRGCMQKFHTEFVLGLRPPGLSIDLHAGACFAHAVETTYKGVWLQKLSLQDALERAYAAFLMVWGEYEIPEYKATAKSMDRMWDAVESYFQEYPPLTDTVQPYFAADGRPTFEYTFAIPLEPTGPHDDGHGRVFPEHPSGGPFLYCGRFDGFGSRQGRPVIKDDKTSGRSPGANWAESWDLRNQFIGYVWAARECGIPVESVVVRGVTILKTEIKHAEAEKVYSQFMIDRWYEQLRRDLWRIRRAWDEGYWDFNLGDQCTQYGNCSFMPLCTSRDPAQWYSTYALRRWNPLDKNPAKDDEGGVKS